MIAIEDVERYVRIFDVDPTEEVVSQYATATRELRRRLLLKRRVSGILEMVDGVSSVLRQRSSIPKSVGIEIARVLSAELGPANRAYGDVELGVCGLWAMLEALTRRGHHGRPGAWATTHVLAAGVWSALSFLPPLPHRKLESLRLAAVGAARRQYLTDSASVRVRRDVPLVDAAGFAEWAANDDACDQLMSLQTNAVLDQEEINILRWSLSGPSRLVEGCGQGSIGMKCRAVILGSELGTMISVPPGQYHRDLCTSKLEEGTGCSLVDLMKELGKEQQELLLQNVDTSLVERASSVFPLVSAMLGCDRGDRGIDLARPISEWGARALVEFSLLRAGSESGATG